MASKQNYVGIDLGGSSLKIVELKSVGKRPQLVTYGFIEETYNIIKDENKQAVKELGGHLKELIKTSKITTDKAVSALPSFSVFSSIISLPYMSKKDLISAVRWEAKKFVPIPLEEMILDWEILDQPGAEGEKEDNKDIEKEAKKKDEKDKDKKEIDKQGIKKGNAKVLLTAAPKNLVNRYVELFKIVGLQLVGLETESFALERSLVGNDKNSIMVIDVGKAATNIIIFSGGVPTLNRSIDVGGQTVTKSLIEKMGVDETQAEQFKIDMKDSLAGKTLEEVPQPISHLINAIVNEVRYILNIYQSQNRQPITKIILTGGSAFLPNLTDYLQEIFRIKVFIGDPWARVIHPVEIDSMLKELGPRMSVSIGLAMREIV
ncbi:pilus assembly protein PilM [Patescibacteria group bacterium]|nr:pilus assembly protein PilM [Patescibacteria group bacterium]MBU0964342.1 pilus assembly protein PilM [Patescibacteria group bacterium]